jgi:hypothetical protein
MYFDKCTWHSFQRNVSASSVLLQFVQFSVICVACQVPLAFVTEASGMQNDVILLPLRPYYDACFSSEVAKLCHVSSP